MVHLYLLLVLTSHLFPNDKELKDHKYDLYELILGRKNSKGTWYTPIGINKYIDDSNPKFFHNFRSFNKNLDEVLKGTLKIVQKIGKNDDLNNLLMLCLQ
jgi:hypothetical protein